MPLGTPFRGIAATSLRRFCKSGAFKTLMQRIAAAALGSFLLKAALLNFFVPGLSRPDDSSTFSKAEKVERKTPFDAQMPLG